MISSFRRARIAGALTTALAFTAFLGAGPAQAHDSVASTSPAEGQTLTTNPGKVTITLTKPPTTGIAGANIIKVTAPDGHIVSTGDITVEGATLSTAADIDHPGKHTVDWRAVSADGHPIEGTLSFTYAPDETGTTAPSAAATPATGTPEPAGPGAAAQAAAPAAQTATADMTGWLIAAGIVIICLAGALVYVATTRKKPDTGK
ncbi:copper resistance protein CopC (plasmid) [Arthrobacter sp. FB24]|uniref:copper resistance CopC family protein n=1 Tax=Arthrobacter sp. (strain FB24) TaxID=290399 RepID=UPI0000526E0C|nr:copper resistance CopC family protein [Arthrobacter sp. FB24]ABK05906.1 copper resistance protein CopC [Arthrobacter sp. FB24]